MISAEAVYGSEKLAEELYPEQLEHALGDKPVGFNTDQNYLAVLQTNEVFEPLLAGTIKRVKPQYLVGIGFSNILTHAYCFDPDELKGIFSVDISPRVVAVGRAVRQLLKECETPQEFVELVKDNQALRKSLSNPNNRELTNYAIETLQERIKRYSAPISGIESRERTAQEFESLFNGTAKPFHVITYSTGEVRHYPDTAAILLSNYRLFRRLASEGKFGIVESNILDKNTLHGIRRLKGYDQGTNVTYLSNLPRIINAGAITDALQQPDKINIASVYSDTSRQDIWAWSGGLPLYTMDIGCGNGQISRGVFKRTDSEKETVYHNVSRFSRKGCDSIHEQYIYTVETMGADGNPIKNLSAKPGPNDHEYRLIHATLDRFDKLFDLPYRDVHIDFDWRRLDGCKYCVPSTDFTKAVK